MQFKPWQMPWLYAFFVSSSPESTVPYRRKLGHQKNMGQGQSLRNTDLPAVTVDYFWLQSALALISRFSSDAFLCIMHWDNLEVTADTNKGVSGTSERVSIQTGVERKTAAQPKTVTVACLLVSGDLHTGAIIFSPVKWWVFFLY